MKTIYNYTLKIIAAVLFCSFIFSCDEFVEVPHPITELGTPAVFNNDAGAQAAMDGIYVKIMDNLGHFANKNTTLFAGLSADEFVNRSTDLTQIEFYENALTPANSSITGLWRDAYTSIYRVNAVLEALKSSGSISENVENQLTGEALFVRAFCHFYLVNFFGAVPYITSTDYQKNSEAAPLAVNEIYQHIISDLKKARSFLTPDYSYAAGLRIRPNYYAATALLARVYLYTKNWAEAETMATEVIAETGLFELVNDLNKVFLANSKEAIWQLQPVISGLNTIEGYSFTCCVNTNFSLSTSLTDTFSIEDKRRGTWIGETTSGSETLYFPYKYQVLFADDYIEYYMILRLAEQYLIRAEARTQQNNMVGALNDLNSIRNRAGLDSFTGNSKEAVLEAIYTERQRELFAEWGHRWFDLKRSGNLQALENKPGWEATDTLYPIPKSELLLNTNLTQNPGY